MEKSAYGATTALGPFGGGGGSEWNDGTNYSTVRQISIRHGDVIDSIQIEYDRHGQSIWCDKRGGNGGNITHVKLNYPDEFLISISGYFTKFRGHEVVGSLTFHSNRRQYGPYGKEQGKYFSTSSTAGKIVGFHGRSGIYLDSVGAYFEPLEPLHFMTAGPFGGFGGDQWNDGTYTTIRQMIIHHGDVVDSILIEYDNNGQPKLSERHGGSGGQFKSTVKLNYPDEFLISISGYCIQYSNHMVVESLTLHSNKKQYGPYGKEQGENFSSLPTAGKIIGFHGRSGNYLESIGAYIEPLRFITMGPFGGLGGNQWDDGTYANIRQMIIHHGDIIDSILIEYDNNGQSKWSERHGGSGGRLKSTVKLDYPGECLVSISGYHTHYSGHVVVRSLIIHSNKRQYGPYGAEQGEYFSTSSTSGKIIGFHGRSGIYLDSIGAYVANEK